MKICLYTPLPRLANELWDVLKLFFATEGFAVVSTAPQTPEDIEKAQFTATAPTDDMQPLTHEMTEKDGSFCCRFIFAGQDAQRSTPVVAGESKLLYRRRVKRLCKLTLYDLCKTLTGKQPPWGALTGIRPTRLFADHLKRGLSHAQAEAALQQEMDVIPEKTALLSRILTVQQALPQAGETEFNIYVAMPFCPTRCTYCTFAGEAIGTGDKLEPYLHALYREMDAVKRLMAQQNASLRALYIGGGTPIAPDDEAFALFLNRVAEAFPKPVEFTVEAGRPDAITSAKLKAMRQVGVGRISINPQTMNDATLQVIGRGHSAAQVEQAFQMAREHGFDHINMDVIAGLPGETELDFRHTMQRIAALGPEGLTVHTLALKRGGQLQKEKTPLPSVETVEAMVALGESFATQMGMSPYYLYRQKYMAAQQQNVGYAKENKACLYNMDMMEETATVLAIGAGAISKRVFENKNKRIVRAPNAGNVDVYIATVDEMIHRKQNLFME